MPTLAIASLVPSLTELLFDLDLGDSLVARTGFCVHPKPRVTRIKKVGGTKDVDVNALLATKPTHLVVNIDENRKETIARLREAIPHVVVTHPTTLDDNLALFAEFGRLFDRTARASRLVEQFSVAREAIRRYRACKPPIKVLYLIWKDPWFTVGRSTYISSLLREAQLDTLPATARPRYPTVANDDGAWHEADVILLSSEPYAFRQKHVDALAAQRPDAVILLVDGQLLSWYGSRSILGLRYLLTLRERIESALERTKRR
jgi:ABC-type Fe3+-hydroxamate transport system substrate-binding protein